jgi:hypothetical protein
MISPSYWIDTVTGPEKSKDVQFHICVLVATLHHISKTICAYHLYSKRFKVTHNYHIFYKADESLAQNSHH